MRLFELFDKPLDYKLMSTRTDANHGEKDYTYGFRVDDYWYKVYVSFYPMLSLMDEENIRGKSLAEIVPPEFVEQAEQYKLVMSIDFGQFDYTEKTVPVRGKIPWGAGEERTGREGTGNELQVFATVSQIGQEMYNKYRDSIGAIEFGVKQSDPNRKRLYNTLMRKFGITGKTRFEFDIDTVDGEIQDRVVIVL